MSEGVIAAVIAGLVAIAVTIIESNSTRKLMEYQINELRKSVEKHNNVIERTYCLEKKTEVIDEKIRVVNRKIDDLERNEKN